ncbi:WecB/TagA/CpsF family glycosyltransferase [Tautonia plasticadhaerens]|uniref:N-acetylmannosaminyltransferase n=1 Tax=Tautonia plasticadhaerens TaxID=2527974 RepID=A0A518HFK7_9BACT|nr:WecB/TagA/CpsF family glycosyltransferase [Tautonia plasticadhaerens]QDV39627.1 Putative N-acetylmannosaminyltransferase [Tautonia plasticadhaerens]
MPPAPIRVWGLPLAPLTRPQAAEEVARLIADGRPSYFITANAHYAMVSDADPAMRPINESAAFILADGAPLVWASRWRRTPLPERVAGSDLIYDLCAQAAERGHRVSFLGGPPGVAEQASRTLARLYPGLTVAGVCCPPFRPLADDERAALVSEIRDARPDLLFVAFGQPKGERWIREHLEELGVPVCVQVGASLEFVAGRVRRAPRWVQRIGLEWAWRIGTDPARLAPRYARNAAFLLRKALADFRRGRAPEPDPGPESESSTTPTDPRPSPEPVS